MFSGIVETTSKIIKTIPLKDSVRIHVSRPKSFNDIKVGDSICVNGICLTVETFTKSMIQFCLGAETLKVLGDNFKLWSKKSLNLERSLQFGQRVHGHLVTGHVDTLAQVVKSYQQGECWQIEIEVPKTLTPYFWKKGSVCLNGVSLTVNEYFKVKSKYYLDVCLIPETIKATNLIEYKEKEFLNIESDYLAKAYIQSRPDQVKVVK
ncbi:MAG: riboflavin synthase [Bdellovibrio sp.]|nr:riboflavin synthase [Bdellovibrio sp.]